MLLEDQIQEIAKNAKKASYLLEKLSVEDRNNILNAIAEALDKSREQIKNANLLDVNNAKENNMAEALIDRLIVDDKRIDSMAQGLKDIIKLENPLNNVLEEIKRPNGLIIKKVSVPIGVIGIIYESRPNVTVDTAGICIKSGNVIILKGGKESINSNKILVYIIRQAIEELGFCSDFVQLVESIDREAVKVLLKMDNYVDLIIPRGGEGLIRMVAENSLIPVLKHYKGVCHIFVDKSADFNMAKDIIVNAKCQRPGVCNAVETVLIHKDIAEEFLPVIAKELIKNDVELRVCDNTKELLSNFVDTGKIKDAQEQDWYEEYLDLILAVKLVDNIKDASAHINQYGSRHSDSIITEDMENADLFLKTIDSAVVYHNASTRFTDGGEFGKGAEMGISTDKLHARGPVGIKELTTYKYLVYGNGQIRE
jgi:glutamate-5-semialdehyde dehydrogenase